VGPSGQEWALGEQDLTVGRAQDNDVRLEDPTVSRYHMRFLYLDGDPTVVDLNSSNGTYINGVCISGVHRLHDGDVIEAGDTKLVFRAPARPERRATEQPQEPTVAPPEPAPQAATEPERDVARAAPGKPPAPPPAVEPVASGTEAPSPATPVPPPAPPPAGGDAADLVTRHQTLSTSHGIALAELSPAGALSIESADRFRGLCDELLAAGHSWFLFDLGNVEYLDSTGLAVLLRLSREARSRGGQVWFFNETPAVHSIFELTNLWKVLRIVAERGVALAEAEELRP
jgi:anti-anti-sigma factor